MEHAAEERANGTEGRDKNSLALPSLILSLAGLLITAIISATNLWVTSIQKEKELEIQALKNTSDRQTSRGELIFKNIQLLNSNNPDEKRFAVAALVWTLGQEDADKLFSSIEHFGPPEVQSAAKTARSEIQTANLTRDANLKAWVGTWQHEFTSSLGRYSGEMTLQISQAGVVSGTFAVKNRAITGSVYEGRLSEDGTILSGLWQNNAGGGQRGRFFFELSRDGASHFTGNYSLYDAPPQKGSGDAWTGIKVERKS